MTRATFALVAALFAAAAVWLWLRPSLAQRLRGAPERVTDPWERVPVIVRPLVRPVPDATPLPLRRNAAMVLGAATAVVARDLPLWVGLALGVVAGAGVFVGLGRVRSSGSRQRQAQLLDDLPAALDLMAACVAAGQPIRRAVAVVGTAVGGPLAEEFGTVVRLVDAGATDREAWDALGTHPVLGTVARDVGRACDAGTMLQAVLTRRAGEARAKRATAAEVRAKSVGVQTVVPLGLCFLPAFLLLGVVPILGATLVPMLG